MLRIKGNHGREGPGRKESSKKTWGRAIYTVFEGVIRDMMWQRGSAEDCQAVETLGVVMRNGTGKIKVCAEGGEIVPYGRWRDEMCSGSEDYRRRSAHPAGEIRMVRGLRTAGCFSLQDRWAPCAIPVPQPEVLSAREGGKKRGRE